MKNTLIGLAVGVFFYKSVFGKILNAEIFFVIVNQFFVFTNGIFSSLHLKTI